MQVFKRLRFSSLILILYFLLCNQFVLGFQNYLNLIPNAKNVPNTVSIGHTNGQGGGPLTPFGSDFKSAGNQWTKEFCEKDSDNDGKSNGEELGDSNCQWQSGNDAILRTTGITHPGVASQVTDAPPVTTQTPPQSTDVPSTESPTDQNIVKLPDSKPKPRTAPSSNSCLLSADRVVFALIINLYIFYSMSNVNLV